MKVNKIFFTISTVLIISISLAACSKAPATTPTQNQNPVNTQPSGGGTVPTQVVATKAPASVPSDIPVMDGSYDLQVPNDLNVTYKVKAPIKDVVTFYQAGLLENGWDQTNNPDSVVGSMAQMSRSKTNGDRITFSLQYNPVGEFTIVQIFLNRVATPAP